MIRGDKAAAIAQCRENIEALLTYHRLPPPAALLTAQTDRVTAIMPAGFDAGISAANFRSWNFVGNHGTTAQRGWRENCATCSMQAIEHVGGVWEFDVDLYNPDYGLAPAIAHWFEVMVPGKTDPFRVARGLRKRGVLN